MTDFHRADKIAAAERQDAYYIEHLMRKYGGSSGPWKHPAPETVPVWRPRYLVWLIILGAAFWAAIFALILAG
jgi:hypothetical protein